MSKIKIGGVQPTRNLTFWRAIPYFSCLSFGHMKKTEKEIQI